MQLRLKTEHLKESMKKISMQHKNDSKGCIHMSEVNQTYETSLDN